MFEFGLIRLAVATPRVSVANPRANVDEMLHLVSEAATAQAHSILFPELAITGYTCGDLFGQEQLLAAAETELRRLILESQALFSGLVVVGCPLRSDLALHNAAVVFAKGTILACVTKSYLPNYREFYEGRYFRPLAGNRPWSLFDQHVALGPDTILTCKEYPDFRIGIEICEDLWVPHPPSSRHASEGATVLFNLSASDELVGKCEYRKMLVVGQSARCMAAYAYAGASVTESTQDLVFGGHALIAENGILLAENQRFARHSHLTIADVDVERLVGDRRRTNTFDAPLRAGNGAPCAHQTFSLEDRPLRSLKRAVSATPFIPSDQATLAERCQEVFHIQTAALAKRIETAKIDRLNIGVSGGLDSTLALLVAVRTCDLLGMPRSAIHGLTMPGFGTSEQSLANAESLMQQLGVHSEKIDIRPLCMDSFTALKHHPFGLDPTGRSATEFQSLLSQLPKEKRSDLVFENIQARLRTFLLMSRGFVVGTGDLSELALGWCTYNGDHMSMYGVNSGVPKTLVRFLVEWVANHEVQGPARDVLLSITRMDISPELLPIGKDASIQRTEETIGPYELHDFFLYYVLRFGFRPKKILFLAEHAEFSRSYRADEIRQWLRVFVTRFFANQFKRSCLPDGPKVGSVCLSPRGDWRMPSDADARAWLKDLDG